MSSGSVVLLVLAVLLVMLASVFAAADAALGAASAARVAELERAGRHGARQFAQVVADRPRHVNLLLLLRLVCGVMATVLTTVVSLRLIGSTALAVVTAGLLMAVVSYVMVGVGPRTIGRQHPDGVGLALGGVVRLLGRVLGPLSRLLILVGNAITPGRGFREGPFSSEVELRELVDLAGERGVVDAGERQMIQSVFDLGDTIAREVMVPRTEMVWIEQDKTVRQGMALCLRSGFSRIPVIGESVDDVVGVVNIKDLARRQLLPEEPGGGPQQRLVDVMRPARFVPDSKRLDSLLQEMQRVRNHLAIVVDEYGGTAGLVTIEDIVEEIVGEITDEFDVDERPPVEHLGDGVIRVSSRLPVDDLGELFGIDLERTDVETVGGLLAQRLGRVPLPGAEAEVAGLRLRAEGGKDHRGRMRITSVTAHRPPPAQPTDEDADNDGAGDGAVERSTEGSRTRA